MRRVSIPLTVVGVLLVAAAAVLRFAVLPAVAQLPADTNVQRTFTGTITTALDLSAVTSGDLAHAVVTNTPGTVQRTVKVLSTDGDRARVRDTSVARTDDGRTLATREWTYVVDRHTLQAAPAFGGAAVQKHTGLTVSFPIGTEKHDYVGWVPEQQTTVPVKFEGTAKRGGLDTHVFTSAVPTGKMTNPAILDTLPTSVPKQLFATLGAALPLTAAQKAQLTAALPSLPAQVPLAYTYASVSTYWVQPSTGEVVDFQRDQTEMVALSLPVLPAPIPIAPVFKMSFRFSPASLAAASSMADSDASQLTLVGTTLPLGFLVVGVLALLGGGALLWRGRHRAEPAGADAGAAGAGPVPGVPSQGGPAERPEDSRRG